MWRCVRYKDAWDDYNIYTKLEAAVMYVNILYVIKRGQSNTVVVYSSVWPHMGMGSAEGEVVVSSWTRCVGMD